MAASPKTLSALVAAAALLSLPGLFYMERLMPTTWSRSIVSSMLSTEPDRHTSIYTGTTLPATIERNTTITPADSPVILEKTVRIRPDTTLTIEPGTLLVAQELSLLINEGSLVAHGTAERPIVITTNEAHPDNQIWSGLMFATGSRGDLSHIDVEHAVPAVSCLKGSFVSIRDSHLASPVQSLYTETGQCQLTNTRLQSPN